MKFSIIVPVYNRVSEVEDLLQSLSAQTLKNFELVIVEDGSTDKCENVVKACSEFPVKYIFKENEGRSIARNVGMENATGDYFIFFDSDCVIPENYFMTLTSCLENNYVDCFGGPDAAHDSFTSTQKARFPREDVSASKVTSLFRERNCIAVLSNIVIAEQTMSLPFLEKSACPLALHFFNTPFLPVKRVTAVIG